MLNRSGQAAIETAFTLPLVFLVLLLLIQPAIVLYTRAVMSSAAHETCRAIATRPSSVGDRAYESFARRRLGAIPPVPIFHEHDPCSYAIAITGDADAAAVMVRIENSMRPLPLVGAVWSHVTGGGGREIRQIVEASASLTSQEGYR